jgi:hypothetical protein
MPFERVIASTRRVRGNLMEMARSPRFARDDVVYRWIREVRKLGKKGRTNGDRYQKTFPHPRRSSDVPLFRSSRG